MFPIFVDSFDANFVFGTAMLCAVLCAGALLEAPGNERGDWKPLVGGLVGVILAVRTVLSGSWAPDPSEFEWTLAALIALGLNSAGALLSDSGIDDVFGHAASLVVFGTFSILAWDFVAVGEQSGFSPGFVDSIRLVAIIESANAGGSLLGLVGALRRSATRDGG